MLTRAADPSARDERCGSARVAVQPLPPPEPASMADEQEQICKITSPLGEDLFSLARLRGTEAISQPFHFDLELCSSEADVGFESLVGSPLHLELRVWEGGERFVSGIVSRFTQGPAQQDLYRYRVELAPWLSLLRENTACRIFQHKNVLEIASQIFQERGFSDFEIRVGERPEREYCVQYRESDFDFISRLLEDEGIAYYFEHQKDAHRLILIDGATGHDACPSQSEARYRPEEGVVGVRSWEMSRAVCTGGLTLRDFDFEHPDLDLTATAPSSVEAGRRPSFEVFDYPGCYTQTDTGDLRAKRGVEALEAASVEIVGTSNCGGFTPGYCFELQEHERPRFDDKYLFTRVEHELTQGVAGSGEPATYKNSFSCIPATLPYRPLQTTQKPVIGGPQTATVVGAAGKEIDVDRYGRVVVQFHWDREGQKNDQSSCRVRVAQTWAGNRWGAIFNPWIGQEVVVQFLEGDPDRPLITGRVYNAKLMPPYDLPANATQSGMKTRSSSGGETRNFNELRFEDKKGSEEIYLHAEKDENVVVENDKNEDVGHDETLAVGNDRRRKVGQNEEIEIGKDQEISVGNDQVIQITNNSSLTAGNQVRIVVGKSSITMNESGTIIIDGVDVYVNGVDLSLRGRDSFKYNSDEITGVAASKHNIKGATVRHNP
jgi:type VI secretion system secreted protein VgrG